MGDAAARAVERAARLSYGRLLALLAARGRDLASAEDALGGALLRALETWPRTGVPDNPEAWLLATGRRLAVDAWRRQATAATHAPEVTLLDEERFARQEGAFPDRRLALMLACAHPAIDPGIRTPLILQTILGIDVRRMASAFLVKPATLGQGLVRAKARIRDLAIGFELPGPEALPERIDAVLGAVYAAYTLGWDDAFAGEDARGDLTEEACWLARIVADCAPAHAEANALLALLLFSEARKSARRDRLTGAFVPLSDQDPATWDAALLTEAEDRLRRARPEAKPGRFGLEAAIQAVHAERRRTGRTDWPAIEHLYRGLVALVPTVGARIGHAAARAAVSGPAEGLALLDALGVEAIATHQPYWATRAHLLAELGRPVEAAEAFERAIGLSRDPAVRQFLTEKARHPPLRTEPARIAPGGTGTGPISPGGAG
ncbi:DUF6596 domain-containing protein [Phreatobacter sp.]|uniref:RNA polymerase sigma factor n=1 Tax=Phreatobacter sp. TaxID=1966341 RepID=UPI0022C53D41|nr:DUF6596 domain-containing protein [Phreatobacter sp.]MCZ8316904.1 sigma factor [Phreatobacter sp.]